MELEEGIRMTRALGFGEVGPGEIIPCEDARRAVRPFRTPRVEDDFRPLGSSPGVMGWWTALPRAMQVMLSTCC